MIIWVVGIVQVALWSRLSFVACSHDRSPSPSLQAVLQNLPLDISITSVSSGAKMDLLVSCARLLFHCCFGVGSVPHNNI